MPTLPDTQIKFCLAVTVTIAAMMLYYFSALEYQWDSSSGTYVIAANLLFKAIFPLSVVISELHIFHRYLNVGGKLFDALTRFGSEAAYAVYLFHPFVFFFFSWCYVHILKAGDPAQATPSSPTSMGFPTTPCSQFVCAVR